MAKNRKSRAGARMRCEVVDAIFYKPTALRCKRQRCDSNDLEGATYRYVQAQIWR